MKMLTANFVKGKGKVMFLLTASERKKEAMKICMPKIRSITSSNKCEYNLITAMLTIK